jgi:ribonuclease Y
MNAIMMQSVVNLLDVLVPISTFVIGIGAAGIVFQLVSRAKTKTFEHDLERQIEGAKREAENIIKSAQIDAAAETIKKKEQFTIEANQIRAELHETEMRLNKREDALDRQGQLLKQQENSVKQQGKEIEKRLHNIERKDKQLSTLMAQQKNQLLKITAMDFEQAKELLLKRLESECEHEMSLLIQRKVEEADEKAEEKSREIMSAAIQRYAAEHTCEVTVSTVEIPNDDMKGRIIGREGRNIRAFEKATGVDVIVDDTHTGWTNTSVSH